MISPHHAITKGPPCSRPPKGPYFQVRVGSQEEYSPGVRHELLSLRILILTISDCIRLRFFADNNSRASAGASPLATPSRVGLSTCCQAVRGEAARGHDLITLFVSYFPRANSKLGSRRLKRPITRERSLANGVLMLLDL